MTKVINLAALTKEPKAVLVMPDGTRHEMRTISVGDFAENLKEAEKLGVNASVEEELDYMIKVLLRAFPTMNKDDALGIPYEGLVELVSVAKGQSGEVVTMDKEEADSGNDPAAA